MAAGYPKAKTAARFAATTALLTVLSGCDGRVGNAVDSVFEPVAAKVGSFSFSDSKPETEYAAAPTGTTVAVAPGNPTYLSGSRAEDLARFEAIYGRPVASQTVTTVASAPAYDLPGYDDGALDVTPISAPILGESATYAAAPAMSTVLPQSYGVAAVETGTVTYGETLTSTGVPILGDSPVSFQAEIVDNASYAATTYEAAPMSYAAPDIMYAESEPVLIDDGYGVATTMVAESVPTITYGTPSSTSVFGDESAYVSVDSLDYTPAPMPAEMLTTDPAPVIDSGAYQVAEPIYDQSSQLMQSLEADMPENDYWQVAAVPAPRMKPVESVEFPRIEMTNEVEGLTILEPSEYASVMESTLEYGAGFTSAPVELAAAPVLGSEPMMTSTGFVSAPAVIEPEPQFVALARTPVPTRRFAVAMAPAPRTKPVLMAAAAPLVEVPQVQAASLLDVTAEETVAEVLAPQPMPRPDFVSPVVTATTAGISVDLPTEQQMPAPRIETSDVAPTIEAIEPTMIETRALTAPAVETMDVAMATPDLPSALPSVAPQSDTVAELSGTSWRLTSLAGAPVDVKAELHFDGTSGFAGGRGPCNSYGGEYLTQQNGFGMRDVFTTDLECDARAVESQYIEALETARSFEVMDAYDGLVLRDGTGAEVARFSAF